MDLSYSLEDEAFRAEVRAFLKAKLPAELSRKVRLSQPLSKADHDFWHT